MASTKLIFRGAPVPSDPQTKPVLIIGQVKHLALLEFDDVKCKLQPRVSKEVCYSLFFFCNVMFL